MQTIISNAYSKASQCDQVKIQESSNSPKTDSAEDMLQTEENFHLLFSTIVWFLEHDPYTNVAMGLDVNFRKVNQENFKAKKGTNTDMLKALIQKNGDTFW